MILQVNDEWRIISDTNQWSVQRWIVAKKEDATTEPYWRSVAYFLTPDKAALWLAGQRIRELPGTYPAADSLELLGNALGDIVDEMKGCAAALKARKEEG